MTWIRRTPLCRPAALRIHFCRIVVESCGGEIGYTPLPAGGNCFWIRLTKSSRVDMKTLVLIDNDALSRALLSQCLTGQGWRVLEAEDGESGLELVREKSTGRGYLRFANAESATASRSVV